MSLGVIPKVWISVDYRAPDYLTPESAPAFEIRFALRQAGYKAFLFSVNRDIEPIVEQVGHSVVFPVVERYAASVQPEDPVGLRRVLELRGVAFVGSTAEVVSNATNKAKARQILAAGGLAVPRAVYLGETDDINNAITASLTYCGCPAVLKPAASRGGSIGVTFVANEVELSRAVETWAELDEGPILVEEYVVGTEITAWVMGIGPELRCTKLIEIDRKGLPIFDRDTKVWGKFTRLWNDRHPGPPQFYSPPRLRAAERDGAAYAALYAHRLIGAYSYSRVDMILCKGVPVILEINTRPTLRLAGELTITNGIGQSFGEALAELVRHGMVRRCERTRAK